LQPLDKYIDSELTVGSDQNDSISLFI